MKVEAELRDDSHDDGERAATRLAAVESPPQPTGSGLGNDYGAGPVIDRPTGGTGYEWGVQAVIDMAMSKRVMSDAAGPLVQLTFLPMVRLAADDPAAVDRAYLDVRSKREKIRLTDSPRERWRKNYGNLVREFEWVLDELRQYFPRDQYEEIVIDTCAAIARQNSQTELDFMNDLAKKAREKREQNPDAVPDEGLMKKVLEKLFDPAKMTAFLVGESEVTEVDEAAGTATMEVPNCAWHTCADIDSLADPSKLPEEGCMLICKGAFERLFDGSEGIKMEFEPHLPETSCTIRLST